jgi:hypothetical protein
MEDQLMVMPQDKAIVSRAKYKVLNWFINFADIYIATKGYRLIKKDEDGYLDGDIEISTIELRTLAKEYEWATTTQYNPTPHRVGCGYCDDDGNYIETGCYWMREFHFFMYKGNPMGHDTYDSTSFTLEKTWENEPSEY